MPKRSEQHHDDPAMGSVDPQHHPPQRFPEADWSWFASRCVALGIAGAEPRRGVLEMLFGHLIGVNRWLNLTTLTSPREYLKLHVLDSLAVEADARSRHLSEGSPCVDLGSGGGYPGLPLALWHPTIPWVLIDARRKKAEFLQAAAAVASAAGAKVRAQHLRGADVVRGAPDLRRRCQLVVCRAMGQASEVVSEAADLLHKSGHLIIYKGPAFAGPERDAAIATCSHVGMRHVSDRAVVLEDGDPARVLAVFQRIT